MTDVNPTNLKGASGPTPGLDDVTEPEGAASPENSSRPHPSHR